MHNQSSLDINEDDSIRIQASTSKCYVKIFVRALRAAFLPFGFMRQQTIEHYCAKDKMCRGFLRVFFHGWVRSIELLKILAASRRDETLHQLCNSFSPKE